MAESPEIKEVFHTIRKMLGGLAAAMRGLQERVASLEGKVDSREERVEPLEPGQALQDAGSENVDCIRAFQQEIPAHNRTYNVRPTQYLGVRTCHRIYATAS